MWIKWCVIDSLHDPDLSVMLVSHVTPYEMKKECCLFRSCLVDAGRMLLFSVEPVFLLMGEAWVMHNPDTQCTVRGERRPKGREDFFFKYLLSCHKNMTFTSQRLRGCGLSVWCWSPKSAGRQLKRKRKSTYIRRRWEKLELTQMIWKPWEWAGICVDPLSPLSFHL